VDDLDFAVFPGYGGNMIDELPDLPDHVVGFSAHGTVTGEDYERTVIPAVEGVARRHGRIRCVYRLAPDFDGFDLAAAWDDAKLGLRHLGGWERIALVSDLKWLRQAARLFAPLMPGTVKAYPDAELDAAIAWAGGGERSKAEGDIRKSRMWG